MAVSWGSWEYAGGNGMRVGLETTWSSVSHSSTTVTASVDIWTENQYTYSDNQVLNYSSNLGADTSFNNNDGGSPQLRATKTYTYTYASGSYGSSPGTVTFSATISGAYNGVTPTRSIAYSIPARPAAAPSSPSLTATTSSSSQIDLSWTAPNNNGATITGYTLQASSAGSTTGFSTIYSGTSRTYSYTGLSKYKQYWFKVLATNSVGSSAYSTVQTATTNATVPGVPTSFVVTPDVTSVALEWTAPTDTGGPAITGYTVTRNGTPIYTGTATSYSDTGLNPVTAYSYSVVATNSVGDSTSATASTTTLGGVVNMWNGSAYVKVLPKVWNGSAWVDSQARIWNGTEWKYGV